MNFKLSIITINFNDAHGLEKTIQSVINQTFIDYEFIIIDGGSTDGSIETIKKHNYRIAYWCSEKDNGIYDAQNKGISKATGEYCLFLNSGDYLYDNNVLLNVFDTSPVDDIVYGDIIYHENGSTDRRRIFPDHLSKHFLLTDVIGHQVQFIKRKVFEQYGIYDTQYKIVADYEIFIRAVIKHKISIKHISIFISVFDLSGLSSNQEQVKKINQERAIVHRMYFSKSLVFLYYTYSYILQSGIYKSKLVAIPVNFIRNFLFKLIRTESNK